MADTITYTLSKHDAAALVNLIGQLPTNSGVYPLLTTLVTQYNEQDKPSTDKPSTDKQEAPKEA